MSDDRNISAAEDESEPQSQGKQLGHLSSDDFQSAKLALQSEFGGRLKRWRMDWTRSGSDPPSSGPSSTDFQSALHWMEQSLAQKERGASRARRIAYPLAMVCLVLGVFSFLSVTIIQDYGRIYDDFGLKLPRSTQWMLALSDSITSSPLRILWIWACVALALTLIYAFISKHGGRIPLVRYFTSGSNESIDHAIFLCDAAIVAVSDGQDRESVLQQLRRSGDHPDFVDGLEELERNLESDRDAIQTAGRLLPANFSTAFYRENAPAQTSAVLQTISQSLRQRLRHRQVALGSEPLQLAVVLAGGVFAFVFFALVSPCFFLISSLSGW